MCIRLRVRVRVRVRVWAGAREWTTFYVCFPVLNNVTNIFGLGMNYMCVCIMVCMLCILGSIIPR